MLKRNTIRCKGHEDWPWPVKLPFKQGWYRHINAGPDQSISREVRGVQTFGDAAVVFTLAFIGFRVYKHTTDGTFKTRLRHLTCMPPALVAQDFDYQKPKNNRFLTREKLDQYREEFAERRGEKVEKWIFKY